MKVAIVGVGMMGGSLGMALRRSGAEVVGLGRSPAKLRKAVRLGACDRAASDFSAVRDADAVVLCTVVDEIVPTLRKILPFVSPRTFVTDIGSVKGPIVQGAARALKGRAGAPQFVGSHPLTGSEKTGAENARPDLYRDAMVALCPLPSSSPSALRRARAFWERVGARTAVMSDRVHDSLVAHTSHLPHILSAGLVRVLSDLDRRDSNAARLLAGSFRDTTRIADSDPRQWAEICGANGPSVAAALRSYLRVLNQALKIAERSERGRADWQAFFSGAKTARKKLLAKSPKFS
jgi:prephenate dehydrogenase